MSAVNSLRLDRCMAITEEAQIKILSAIGENTTSQSLEQVTNEKTVLLHKQFCCLKVRSTFKRTVCLKSKPIVLTLLWSFLASVLHWINSDLSSVIFLFGIFDGFNFLTVVGGAYIFFALLQLFYPLAGLLADVRYGRYKCVIFSLWSTIIGVSLLVILSVVFVLSRFYLLFEHRSLFYALLIVVIVFGVPSAFLYLSSAVAFNANVIQFGLDQLLDSPTDHLVLYIHWYVLLSYAGTIIIKLAISIFGSVCLIELIFKLQIPLFYTILGSCFLTLLLSLCIGYCKFRSLFLPDSGSGNPYKLVYKVISFARKHKTPIQRSAFTYCEDELPSRLDLGKEKYGGPFTTEQVENVKVLLGISRVLLSLGPLFSVERSINVLLPILSIHLSGHSYSLNCISSFVVQDVMPVFLALILLIFYIVALRPLIYNCIPGARVRMWLGMMLQIAPILCFFIFDVVGHTRASQSLDCFLTEKYSLFGTNGSEPLGINSMYLFFPYFSYSCGFLIFHVAIFEFICSQSPHSMKGLLIGTFYAIRGVFQLLGALLFMFPFLGWRLSPSFPSCGFVYYLINMIVALIGIVAYTWAATKYQNRQRDEPDNIYRYAEEYYDKIQDEPNSDDEDYDNLSVHTIG